MSDFKTWINVAGYIMHGRDKYQHRTIAAKALVRPLKRNEVVHHIDYNPANNDPSNLLICKQGYHMLIHARTDCLNAGFSPNTHALCSDCKTYLPRELFPKCKSRHNGLHNVCSEHANAKRRGKGYGKWNEKLKLQQQVRRAAARLLKVGLPACSR